MIKILIDKENYIYMVDEELSKIIQFGIANNGDYYFEFFEYGNIKKIDFEIPKDNKIYDVFLNFYNTLMESYLKRNKDGIYEYYYLNYNIAKLYENGIITICSDDADDKEPNILRICILEDKINLQYEKNTIYSNSIRIRTRRSAYQEFIKDFHQLFQDLKSSNEIKIENDNEAFQMTKKYKEVNKIRIK